MSNPLHFLNSFAKFHPYNLSISINIGDGFLTDLNFENDQQSVEYLRFFFDQTTNSKTSEEAINFINKKNSKDSKDSKNKILLHHSSIIHESKHFHDYVLSPVGNYIIRRYFYLYAYIFPLLSELSIDNNTLLTPIGYMEKMNQGSFSDACKHFIKSKNEYINDSIKFLNSIPILDENDERSKNYKISGNDIFEASAVLAQFSQIEDNFGTEISFDFQQYIKNHIPNYTNTIETLQLLLAKFNKESGYVVQDNELLNTILFASLCGNFNEQYETNAQNPSERFALIFGALITDENINTLNAKNIFKSVESLAEKHNFISVKKSLEDNIGLNKKHYILVEKILTQNHGIDAPNSKQLLQAYQFFINYNEKMTKLFLDNPSDYLRPLNYSKKFLPNMPVPTILEDYSGIKIPMYIQHEILKKDKIQLLTFHQEDYQKIWSILFKHQADDLNHFSIESLYNRFSPSLFLLTEGEKANYNLVNPICTQLISDAIKEYLKIDLKEAFPISKQLQYEKRMQGYCKIQKIKSYVCDICTEEVHSTKGYLVNGNELYNNRIFHYLLANTLENYTQDKHLYNKDFSMYAICENCYKLLKF